MRDVFAFEFDVLAWVAALIEQVDLLIELQGLLLIEASPTIRTRLHNLKLYLFDLEPTRQTVRMEHMITVSQLHLLVILDGAEAYDAFMRLLPIGLPIHIKMFVGRIREIVLDLV